MHHLPLSLIFDLYRRHESALVAELVGDVRQANVGEAEVKGLLLSYVELARQLLLRGAWLVIRVAEAGCRWAGVLLLVIKVAANIQFLPHLEMRSHHVWVEITVQDRIQVVTV